MKKKRNDLNREELEILLEDLIKSPPLFSRVEVKTINNFKWK